jgi:hypothetical protein
MRFRLRQIFPAATSLALVGCLPGSSGPSIPPIPRSAEATAPARSVPGRPQGAEQGKKFSPRVMQKTQTSPRTRPLGAE